jgi:hypothetical protein
MSSVARASHAPRVLCAASPFYETVPAGDVAAALAAGVASAGGRPRSLVLELEADGIGLALAPGPSGARRSAGAPARDLEAAIATAVLERPHVPDLLIGSALCSVSIDVVDDSTLEESVCAEIVGSTAEFGVSCVILGDCIERDAAYRLLRTGVRAITPLGHPGRSCERARLTCRDDLERHDHHATRDLSLP